MLSLLTEHKGVQINIYMQFIENSQHGDRISCRDNSSKEEAVSEGEVVKHV